jgi:hypothetical protein
MRMSFETIYDLREAGCRSGALPLYGLILTVVTAFLWRRQRRAPRIEGVTSTQWAGYALLFFILFTLMTFFATWAQYWALLDRIDQGEGRTVEGVVTDFVAAPDFKRSERFRIAGREFTYGRYETQQGFHTVRADGGPIAPGVKARILYFNNHILRLEIERALDESRD